MCNMSDTVKRAIKPIEWQTVTITLAELVPWEDNPKLATDDDYAYLVTSYEQLGQFSDIVIGPRQDDGLCQVYDGHQRLSAWLKQYGPAHIVTAKQSKRHLTLAERQALAIHARQIGRWDFDALATWEFTFLEELGFDENLLIAFQADAAGLAGLLHENDLFGDEPPSLEDLEEEYGEPDDEDFWPVISIKVHPETHLRWRQLLPEYGEAERLEELMRVYERGGGGSLDDEA